MLYKSRCDNRLNEITEQALADKREVFIKIKIKIKPCLIFFRFIFFYFYKNDVNHVFQAEMLAKKYEDKYKLVAEVASKLTIEEASFRDIHFPLYFL